jgi:hypothetical protein
VFDGLATFWSNVAYSFVQLVVPMFAWTGLVVGVSYFVASRLEVTVGRGLTALFAGSFALVGGVAGVIAGATLEAIVGASLAALLGIVSSLLAYLFGKEALADWRPVIPLTIMALVSSALVGLVIGGSRRTELLAKQREFDRAKFFFENIHAPAERDRRNAYYKKCMDEEKSALDAYNNCADMDGFTK